MDAARAARRVLENADGVGAEVLVTEEDSSLTRFANSEIHQNVTEHSVFVRVRVIEAGGRVGVASTNQVDDAALRDVLGRARQVARAQEPQDNLPALAGAAAINPFPVVGATAESSPGGRAAMVKLMCDQADAAGVRGFGLVSAAVTTYTMANTAGLMVSSPRSVAQARMVAMDDAGGSGYGARTSQSVDELEVEAVAAAAVDRARRYRDPITLEPGRYPIVMEEEGIGELMEYMAYIGFGALAVEEGRTFMRPGERITGANIHIWDDGLDPGGLPIPFDFEGVPKQRAELIKDGVAVGLVHDLATAARAGVASTGHGLPSPNPAGPMATNIYLDAGTAASTDELCAGIERGVWVTRLWYVNVVDPTQSVLTGMTRDGTFLIEDGKVTRPVKNMRFTQSVMDAFASCSAATARTRLTGGSDYGFTAAYRVPAMRLDSFNFTSATK
ncbi:MAG: TldD/PmbA family protein [Candidatus Dormibacteria bacterium]